MTASSRPFLQAGIEKLESLAGRDAETDAKLLAELQHRKITRRTEHLRNHLLARLNAAGDAPHSKAQHIAKVGNAQREPAQSQLPLFVSLAREAPPIQRSNAALDIAALSGREAITNKPSDILDAWTALEVLSPASYRRPADITGDARNVVKLANPLPWHSGAKGPPGKRLYFQIVLGSIDMAVAVEQLLQRFGDGRAERPQARGEAAIAVVMLDREGRPIDDRCATLSSFGWGLPIALFEETTALANWPAEEARISELLHKRLFQEEDDGKAKALDMAAIHQAFEWLVDELGLDRGIVRPPAFGIRSTVNFQSKEPPEPLLLNSFFLKDLAKARKLSEGPDAPDLLMRFLGAKRPAKRRDLKNDYTAIEQTVAPLAFPRGRWPGPGRHPLVMMQQAAVNIASATKSGEILAVNGPPGTGKTTLLRDVIAALVTERASAMATFDDPEQAFKHSGQKLKMGQAWVHIYALDPRLKGFEMLVASSNNKAVENVSGELPALGAVAADSRMRYFCPAADAMIGGPSWGAIAAVLGNGSNRYQFKQNFWWDKDFGLATYLKAVTGLQVEFEEEGKPPREPQIVSKLDPPRSQRQALANWKKQREIFRKCEKRVSKILRDVEQLRVRGIYLPAIEERFKDAEHHGRLRPHWLHRIFHTRKFRDWKAAHRPLSDALSELCVGAASQKSWPDGKQLKLSQSPWFGSSPDKKAAEFRERLAPMLSQWRQDRQARGGKVIDEGFFDSGHSIIQRTAPWLTEDEHRARDNLFEAAMDLHRAFLDAAAKPLRHNLGLAMQVIDGKGLGDPARDAFIPDIWSSLFLVVPALSTTFASVGNMLGKMPEKSLGWLLIDEAGQAAPQQAVGAILRAQHAVVVGDPIQVPPVVMLPDRLVGAICGSFGVDAERFGAPAASVQTLADDATAWFAEFPSGSGSRTVGVPLLVHRRCADPMFKISNKVAYENLMVQAKGAGNSAIRACLGPSRWIDIQGSGRDKWCLAEGQETVRLLEQLIRKGVSLDIYIVTPFVQVADGLRKLIADSPDLRAAIQNIEKWVYERVGTVHTVQGREAEAVIFVLGAPNADQAGARNWAGQQPNLLNVAVTRAKEVLYVIGNRNLWSSAGVFSELDRRME